MENSNLISKMRIIPPKPRQAIGNLLYDQTRPFRLRVCAYARVSTDSEEQESSYENQVRHFTDYIKSFSDWEYVRIYADEGLSGKNIKRPEFVQMMRDCEDGKIDKIITKSVSRFARNTIDCIQAVRKLKELGIGVLFEKENLDTLKESSEFVLTLMASLAEEESRSISNNIRWSVRKRFEQGKVIISTANFLGYTKNEDGNLKVVPEEAVTIKRIYKDFLDGKSLKQICNGLEQDEILSPSRKEKWCSSTVLSILTNEKYKGDCLLQKTYMADFLSPRRVKNEGQAQMYYVEDSHCGIVSKEIFECVQQELSRRKELRSAGKTGKGKYSGRYVFSGKIKCGNCGETYRRHQQYYREKKYYIWVCKRHENKGMAYCSAKPMKEESLKSAFMRALNRLLDKKDELFEELRNEIGNSISDVTTKTLAKIDAKIQQRQDQLMAIFSEKQEGRITEEEYNSKSSRLELEIDRIAMGRCEVESEFGKMKLADYRKEEILRLFDSGELLKQFDEIVFRSLVHEIKVKERHEIEIEFECGITVNEIIE